MSLSAQELGKIADEENTRRWQKLGLPGKPTLVIKSEEELRAEEKSKRLALINEHVERIVELITSEAKSGNKFIEIAQVGDLPNLMADIINELEAGRGFEVSKYNDCDGYGGDWYYVVRLP